VGIPCRSLPYYLTAVGIGMTDAAGREVRRRWSNDAKTTYYVPTTSLQAGETEVITHSAGVYYSMSALKMS
jgi:hypothetical protein